MLRATVRRPPVGSSTRAASVIASASGPGAVDADLTWAEATARGRKVVGRQYLEGILDRFGGNVVDAATHAGVERESFYRLMRRFGVDPSRFRE